MLLAFNKNTTLFPDCQIFIPSYFLKHDLIFWQFPKKINLGNQDKKRPAKHKTLRGEKKCLKKSIF
ncbi:conserved hypothetical protein [Capnocytophaga canimorsus]|uniref:Uncharacterized protein n=1 Tax=Capnocytophaga canimorsus TaxID=28188 RepID=A0A0B7IC44_9FLAO|nr:conserved hypothetical protein [Capnocytophaga canimorsus]